MSTEVPAETSEIAVIDELGNTVGMLVSSRDSYSTPTNSVTNPRCPVPCSKQAKIAAEWLQENFEENLLTSVPRSEMFEEYISFCCELGTKPFNQAVFGKVVRACFPNLATRRLGVRGHSRYHYAGLSVKRSSVYSERFHCNSKRYNLHRLYNYTQQRRRDVTPHVTANPANRNFRKSKYRYGSSTLLLPQYPTEDDIVIGPEWSRGQMSLFLGFYRCYNKQLLKFITNLDFEKAYNHVRNFVNFAPEDCHKMFQTTFICDVIVICDDIMYQEASTALIPDCLATLESEFSVTLRKFAKALPLWIAEGSSSSATFLPDNKVVECRKQSAKQWGEHVRQVTTLCHVTKEARKTLIYPTIVVPLLHDLRSIPIKEIAGQCAFAGNGDKVNAIRECKYAQRYVKRFCNLLQNEANVEAYAYELEFIVEKHAGLKEENSVQEEQNSSAAGQLSTNQTRDFMMKWAAYGSKILTEITLKSSESVGSFHLVMLLFGDYINHVITLKNERAKRISRLRSVIRNDSSYFQRMRSASARNSIERMDGSSFILTHNKPCTPKPLLHYTRESVLAPKTTISLVSNSGSSNCQTGCSAKAQLAYPGLMNAGNCSLQQDSQLASVLLHQPCTSNVRPSTFYVVPGPLPCDENIR